MTFGQLILIALARNWLRSLFAFAAVIAAFCLFGALETMRYEREGPTTDQDVIVVQQAGSGGFPPAYESTVLSMNGVAAAIGVTGFPALNVHAPTRPLIVLAANAAMVGRTFQSLRLSPEFSARWQETRIGALADEHTAADAGWKVNDRISVPMLPGMRTAKGEGKFEVTLLGTYPSGLTLSGLLIRQDYLRELLPQNSQLSVMFVRPARGSEARALAQKIDATFKTGPAPSLSAPLYEANQSSAKDASTIRLAIVSALAISFFTMILIVTNAFMQSARERIGEMAVMEALGFQRSTIVLLLFAEALLLLVVGAAVGLVIANIGFAAGVAGLSSSFQILPAHTTLIALVCAVACAFIGAALPWRELSKVQVAEALRQV